MEIALKDHLKKYNLIYYNDLNNNEMIKYVYDLLINNKLDETINDPIYLRYVGHYYRIKEKYENMKKYYLMAIEKGNSNTMNNLGSYYEEIKDYENMMKYYLMAIEKDHSSAMFKLG